MEFFISVVQLRHMEIDRNNDRIVLTGFGLGPNCS